MCTSTGMCRPILLSGYIYRPTTQTINTWYLHDRAVIAFHMWKHDTCPEPTRKRWAASELEPWLKYLANSTNYSSFIHELPPFSYFSSINIGPVFKHAAFGPPGRTAGPLVIATPSITGALIPRLAFPVGEWWPQAATSNGRLHTRTPFAAWQRATQRFRGVREKMQAVLIWSEVTASGRETRMITAYWEKSKCISVT
jgi:hypothetical protein